MNRMKVACVPYVFGCEIRISLRMKCYFLLSQRSGIEVSRVSQTEGRRELSGAFLMAVQILSKLQSEIMNSPRNIAVPKQTPTVITVMINLKNQGKSRIINGSGEIGEI